MNNKRLIIQQLDNKIAERDFLKKLEVPPTGWIKAIRTALGMSMQQLGHKLSITKQSVRSIEEREKIGSITIKSIKEVAAAMDMHFVYALVPNDGSLDSLIERKAGELAKQIVMRTSNTMKLENQENSAKRIEKAIKERATELKNEIPKILWD